MKLVKNSISYSVQKVQKSLKQVPQKAYTYWVSITPVDSGNARNRTKLSKDTIRANYAYAERLDRGWSKQAPIGMSKPTTSYVKQLVKSIMKK